VGWLHPEALHEASALRFWDGDGTVRLLADAMLPDTAALLLERCEPGTPLARLPELETEEVLGQLLPRLWREPPPGHPFPSLQSMCETRADEFEAEVAGMPAASCLDPGLERAGLDLFRSLPRTADRHVLLGTDLHAQNILAASRKPWLAIDPKPYVGDPACEPLQYMINCRRLRSDPGELVNGWLACSDSAQSVSGCGRSRAASRSHPAARTWPASPPRSRLSEPAAAGQAGAGAPDQSWPPSLISGRTSTAP
jgi:streptomycin 6-kinase